MFTRGIFFKYRKYLHRYRYIIQCVCSASVFVFITHFCSLNKKARGEWAIAPTHAVATEHYSSSNNSYIFEIDSHMALLTKLTLTLTHTHTQHLQTQLHKCILNRLLKFCLYTTNFSEYWHIGIGRYSLDETPFPSSAKSTWRSRCSSKLDTLQSCGAKNTRRPSPTTGRYMCRVSTRLK